MNSEIKVLAFVGAILLSAFGAATYWEKNYDWQCIDSDEVVSVGGCNRDGFCGVMLKSGKVHREYSPVVGQTVCLKQKWNRKNQ